MPIRPRRSLLFTPGSRPDMVDKALAAGADAVCLDLEDAVAPGLKDEARTVAIPFLAASPAGTPERIIRINSPRTADGLRDLLAIVAARPTGGVVFLPKVDRPEEVKWVDGLMTEAGLELSLAALIETVEGLEHAADIAAASPRMIFVLFGAVDLSAELGIAIAHEPLLYARSRVVHAAKRAGIDAIDVPCLEFGNVSLIEAEARSARSLGFTGKAMLHPASVAPVNAVFSPSVEEIAYARRAAEAFRASSTGLAVVDGKLVERPVMRSIERTLAVAEAMHLQA